jgi:hypothetical protein
MIQTNYRSHRDAQKAVDKMLDNAATKLSKVMRGHKERQIYKYLKDDYPKIKEKYKELVSNTQPSTSLQTEPITLTPSQQSSYEQELLASRTRARQLYEQALQRHSPSTNLQRRQDTYENELNDTVNRITNKALRTAQKEIQKEEAVKVISNAAKRKATNQQALRKGITRVQNRISEIDTRPPKQLHLFLSKKGVVKVTPQVKAEEKQYLRKIEDQYKKYYTPLKEPGNTRASSAASSRLSTASTLGQQTPAKRK